MKRRFILLSLVLLAAACQDNSYKTFSRKYRVSYSCNVMDAPFNQIIIPGHFLSVRKIGNKLKVRDSDGKETEIELSVNQNSSYQLGLAGIILGTPTLNNDDMSIWAYDLGCPSCESESVRLSFDINGAATCTKCKGTWSLNASGFPADDQASRPLYRYPVMKSGNTVTVSN